MRQFIKSLGPAEESIRTGKLNLLLEGFARQDVVPVYAILRALDRVPDFHLEGLREIVYLPEYARAAAGLGQPGLPCSSPRGEFVQGQRRIFVYAIDDPGMFFQMLFHEIGHFVFYLVIGSRVKKRWVTQVSPGSSRVTPYAALSPSEDFAETYAFYLRRPGVLERDFPEKHAFMRDWVFSGRPDTLKERAQGTPGRRSFR